jgi:hypothetical protein
MNEADLEHTVISYLGNYLKDHFVLKCKMDIKNSTTNLINKPDLAFIRKDYLEWYIVEVELSNHEFSHIKEQVETFLNCNYNHYHAQYLYKQNKTELDKPKLEHMINTINPHIMVIINDVNCKWHEALGAYNCKIGIFQIYYNRNQERVYRIQGDFPLIKHDFATCTFITGIPFMVEIIEKDFFDGLDIKNGELINASYRGKISRWKRVDTKKKLYLECKDSYIPLDPLSHRYIIIYNKSEQEFQFEKA